jgi:hypothetical protein
MSMLAGGLARRFSPEFAWANASGSISAWEAPVRSLLVEGSPALHLESIDPAELEPHPVRPGAIRNLVDPEGMAPGAQAQLLEFLRLPVLLQRLVSRGSPEGGPSPVVLTNIDAFPSDFVRGTLGSPQVHEVLHRESVTLVVTFRGEPPTALSDAFDWLLRVESPMQGPWVDSLVRAERGPLVPSGPLASPLRKYWVDLGLDPGLLGRHGSTS